MLTHTVIKSFCIVLGFVGLISCQKETVRPPFTPNKAVAGQPVQFEANRTSDSYQWNFGDSYDQQANTSHEKNPVHTYQFPGTYKVTLKIMKHATYEEFSGNVYVN